MGQDVEKFVKNSDNLLRDELGVVTPPKDPCFVDFLQDSPEPTGEELWAGKGCGWEEGDVTKRAC